MNYEQKYLKYKEKYINLKRQFGGEKKDIFIIGISGASGCGKSYFAKQIKEELEKNPSYKDKVEIISCDNYYIGYK
jgi:uridine kinase